ncbi:MAG TPA: glutamine amidotransferase [Patescibacteria group bacterium]|nr:glutamine amidotransferase [Patescibacteria group bacterium]
MADIHLVHLYHDLMNIYGDRGNILTLALRCRWRNISIRISEISLREDLPLDTDVLFFGGGQDQQQEIVSHNLQEKKESFTKLAHSGVVMLAICGGYQLLGKFYKPHHGEDLPGVGVLDIETVAGNTRMIGNCVVAWEKQTLVGFENHSGKTYLGRKAKPLGEVLIGHGNNGEDFTEGAVSQNIFGCYLHGSLLPKNPRFADMLITRALERKTKKKVLLPPLSDRIEEEAHRSAVKRARQTK